MFFRLDTIRDTITGSLRLILVSIMAAACLSPHDPQIQAESRGSRGKTTERFRLGDAYQSDLNVSVRLGFGTRAPAQGVSLRGIWHTTVTDIMDGSVKVACRLSHTAVDLSIDGERNGATEKSDELTRQEERFAKELSDQFFLSHRKDGTLENVHFPKEMSSAVQDLLMTVATELQVVVKDMSSNHWTSNERDINGDFLAVYRRLDTPGWFYKQKVSYTHSAVSSPDDPFFGSTAGREAAVTVSNSKRTFKLSESGRLTDVTGQETIRVDIGDGLLVLTTDIATELNSTVNGKPLDEPGAFARMREELTTLPIQRLATNPKDEMARQDRLTLGGATLTELVYKLDAIEEAPQRSNERREVEAKLKALFRLNASACERAVDTIRKGRHTAALIGALTLAGSPAAQEALSKTGCATDVPIDVRKQALQGLSFVAYPTVEAEAAVASLLRDDKPGVRRAARFTYGAHGRSLRVNSPRRARRITAALMTLFASSPPSQRPDLITALGNAAHPDALPFLRQLIESGEATIKSRSIRALSYIEGRDTDEMLLNLMQDEDPLIRTSAVYATAPRNIGPFTLKLAEAAQNDPSEHVRSAAIGIIGRHLVEFPKLEEVLAEAQRHDANEENRQLAARYLGTREESSM